MAELLSEPQVGSMTFLQYPVVDFIVLITSGAFLYTGIGKSMFGFWLLYRWAYMDERVVLVKGSFYPKAAILLCPDGAFMLDNDQLDMELKSSNKVSALLILVMLIPFSGFSN